MNISRIRNIILDWSGTLVNDFPPVLEATNEIFRQYNKPPMSEEEFREKFFLPFPEFYKRYLPEATMVQLDHYYHSAFKLLQENIPLLEHARSFLDFCQARGYRLFLLSTIHAEHWEVQSARLNVRHYFTQAYVQAIDKRKTILHLLAEHDLDPAETMFVGDMVHDIETAHHGGVLSCAVLTGYDSLEKLKKAEPHFIFRHLGHLQDFLMRHAEEVTPSYAPTATVGALVFDEAGDVLMIRTYKWSHKWGIPGGKIRTHEKAEEALKREVLEETGLSIGDIRFVLYQDCICSTEFYKPAHFVLLNYTARVAGRQPSVQLNEEADQYVWVAPGEAYSLDLNTPTRILLDYVLSQKRF
ncbi:MAG: HAD hydrolase-like protein [Methylacidiphilales bacterium]|nr:HAD hydrolase-like protein [Candidatus Methylacidiphilales bacterium]MDW8349174.1 HAD hydrolase-like protein [Verrucomicrobiae bacterium]